MSPGPDFVFVTRTAILSSRSRALRGVFGIVTGQIFWSGLSLVGLSLLFSRFPELERLIASIGGLYLLWMAWGILRSVCRVEKTPQTNATTDVFSSAGDANERENAPLQHPFFYGLLTNLANPKALVYFGSIFSTFVTPDVNANVRVLLFVLMTAEALLWFMFVALLFGSDPVQRAYRRFSRTIDALTGVLFGLFAVGLLFSAWQD